MKKEAQTLIETAVARQATDVYILPAGARFQVLVRRLTDCERLGDLSAVEAAALMSHFKFVAGMNVGEKRRPQLGACLYELGDGTARRLRLSSVGDFEGRESLVIRLLHDLTAETPDFWFDGATAARQLIGGRGLYLFSGPVGSGKTTLMYHLARQIFGERQVITIEDPVEIVAPEFLQLQRNDVIGSTYEALIKLSLRHMPDLVIVGEIRDEATARAVIRAGLTGYTVFSTVHARSVSGVYARLLELGLSRGEIDNALRGVIYQRLIGSKGLLEGTNKNFETYDTTTWNEKIDRLVAAGHLEPTVAQAEKIEPGQANQAYPAHE